MVTIAWRRQRGQQCGDEMGAKKSGGKRKEGL
jgi:hypothetical protein